MSAAKHTPGPFTVEDREERFVIFADHFHGEVASLSCYQQDAETEEQAEALRVEQEANADLFSAASDLADQLTDAAARCASLHGARYPAHRCATCAPWKAALRKAGRLQ